MNTRLMPGNRDRRWRHSVAFAVAAVGLTLMPSSASAQPVAPPLTVEQKEAGLKGCERAGGTFRACCKLVGGAYESEEREDGTVDESCSLSRSSGVRAPLRRIVADLSRPATNPRGPIAPILGGVLKPPAPAPTTPPAQ